MVFILCNLNVFFLFLRVMVLRLSLLFYCMSFMVIVLKKVLIICSSRRLIGWTRIAR